ncbi:MAG: MarR family winged helix-turn-helix transcriptional regulator [Cohaesibacteraceae bacterium]
MAFNHRKTVTYRLVQAAKAYRQRSAQVLGKLNLYPGQDQILKALGDDDGQTMGALASTLSVQPPTITKMVARLSGQGLVERRREEADARSARVHLTAQGRMLIAELDKALKRLERSALFELEDKDRKRLRKTLRQVERNLNDDVPLDTMEDDEVDLVEEADQDSPSLVPTLETIDRPKEVQS